MTCAAAAALLEPWRAATSPTSTLTKCAVSPASKIFDKKSITSGVVGKNSPRNSSEAEPAMIICMVKLGPTCALCHKSRASHWANKNAVYTAVEKPSANDIQRTAVGGWRPVSSSKSQILTTAPKALIMYAPLVSQERHWGLNKMNQKRSGLLRSATSSAPVIASAMSATTGATFDNRTSAASKPNSKAAAPTKADPADIDLVHR